MFQLGLDSVHKVRSTNLHRFSPRLLLSACRLALCGLAIFLPLRSHAAGALREVHLQIAGKEVVCKPPALADDSETYIPLEVLGRVGATGKVARRGETVLVTEGDRHAEIAIARPHGTPMIALSDLAHLLDAAVVRPPATDPNHKPVPGKPGDIVYLLAVVEGVDVEAGGVRVKTSFPVPYHIGMVENASPPSGYVDCEGAALPSDTLRPPYTAGKRRQDPQGIHLLRASVDTARIVIQLDRGVTLHPLAPGSGPESSILVALEKAPVQALPAPKQGSHEGPHTGPNVAQTGEVAQSVDLTLAGSPDQRSEAPRMGPVPALRVQPAEGGETRIAEILPAPGHPGNPALKGSDTSKNPNNTAVATTERNPAGGADVNSAGKGSQTPANPGTETVAGTSSKQLPSRSGSVQRPVTPIEVRGLEFITDNMSQARVEIATSAKAAATIHYLPGTTQMVLDIPNAKLNLPQDDTGERKLTHPLLSHIGIALPDEAPGTARVTLDMDRILGYTLVAQPDKLVLELRIPRNATGALADKLIVVDAGHGGAAAGAPGHGPNGTVYEKNITLAIAMKLRTVLEAAGARVVMTRDSDIDVGLYDRTKLANSIGADLFISIHNDSSPRAGSASGTSTYYHMSDPSSRALAICVQDAVHAVTGLPSRGALSDSVLYASGLAVLRTSNMPAVLCEVAYINNTGDRNKLVDPDFQQRVAQAMCNGLRAYVEGQPKSTPNLMP